jgi:carbon monoxide dehydrogenase subunit G
MPTALERSYERTVRIGAPLEGLYEELDSVHGLARFIPQLDSSVLGSDDSRGACRGVFSIGPLSYEVDGDMTVERAVPLHSLEIALRAPSLRLELEGAFEFMVSAQDETTLRYSATIRSAHPLLRRMPSALTGALEEHVDTTTDLISVRARQYTQAKRRLADLE